ncbi:hypothetical protein [Prauserella muralis]|uniref:Uncharacterized protein n=1 Tax=Prauserella muralis TaxID=588067 RepID=A0A2V4B7I6_9PSEU|nr:hypothetical protein [Prauserella muralis]PXY31345.1 hypothetical protein BAY60_02845 [Prauserella muralis]TWE14334.1 hypothetical protein FHX69_6474 [Prauserella muralis]
MPLPSFGRLSSRSNLKPVNGGRHRGSEPIGNDADPAAEDHELTSYLAALAPDSDPESTGSGRRFGDAQVYQLRMNLIASQQLKDIAAERGTSPQALAQEWVMERLAWEGQTTSEQRGQTPSRQPARNESPRSFGEPQTDRHYFDAAQWEPPLRGTLR